MANFTKDQLLHLDLPEAFREYQEPLVSKSLSPSWDLMLLGITLFWVLENNKELPANNNV